LSGDLVEEFLAWQRAGGRHCCQWSRPGLVCLLEVLRGLGVLGAEEPVPAGSPNDLLLASFERYLLTEPGWPLALPAAMWGTRAGSWTGWRPAVSLPG
jgi:hypothetical protein